MSNGFLRLDRGQFANFYGNAKWVCLSHFLISKKPAALSIHTVFMSCRKTRKIVLKCDFIWTNIKYFIQRVPKRLHLRHIFLVFFWKPVSNKHCWCGFSGIWNTVYKTFKYKWQSCIYCILDKSFIKKLHEKNSECLCTFK